MNYYKKKPKVIKQCKQCGKDFKSVSTHHKFCNPECTKLWHKEENEREMRKGLQKNPTWFTIRFEIFKRDDFSCQYCGRSAQDNIKLHLEHIKPLSKGGTFAFSNLITSCEECNLGKTDVVLAKHQEMKMQSIVKDKTSKELKRAINNCKSWNP